MENFHFTQFNFPIKEKITEITRPQMRLKKRRLSCSLAYKSKSNASSPVSKENKIKPEDLTSFGKTSIFHVEEIFSAQGKNKFNLKPLKMRKNLNETSKLYQRMLDVLEKKKETRLNIRRKVKSSQRNNPWRYSLADSCCIFDVTQLAKSTFKSETVNLKA